MLGDMLELGTRALRCIMKWENMPPQKELMRCSDMAPTRGICWKELPREDVPAPDISTPKKRLSTFLKDFLRDGDAVLYKASRGMAMEEVVHKVHDISAAH